MAVVEDVESIGFEMMFRPTPFVNLGPIIATYNEKKTEYNFSATEVGLRLDFVFSNSGGFSDGFYLSNSVLVGRFQTKESFSHQNCSISYSASGGNVVAAGVFGYQWFWGNGYNVNLGGGIVKSRPMKVKQSFSHSCDQEIDFSKEFKHWYFV